MNTHQLLLSCRDKLADPSGHDWTDAELMRYINEAYISLAGEAMAMNVSMFQTSVVLLGSNARLLSNQEYQYDLPFPTSKVIDVREGRTTSDRGASVGKTHAKHVHSDGWTFDGFNTLRVRGAFAGKDLCLEVQKRPAILHHGTVPVNSDTCQQMYLASTVVGELETHVNIYQNAIFQMTGANSGDHRPSGQYNAASGSEPHVKATDNNYYSSVSFRNLWVTEPQANDTYSMVPEFPETTHLLIALKAVRQAYHRTNNVAGLQTTKGAYEEEKMRFKDAIRSRQSQGPEFVPTLDEAMATEDLDRDPLGGYYRTY